MDDCGSNDVKYGHCTSLFVILKTMKTSCFGDGSEEVLENTDFGNNSLYGRKTRFKAVNSSV